MKEQLQRELESLQPMVELDPASAKGNWLGSVTGNEYRRLEVDYGCGMGEYVIKSAKANPVTLFVGVDCVPYVIADAAQNAIEAGVSNVRFALIEEDDELAQIFDAEEVDMLHINFPTPHARAHDAEKRMTCCTKLIGYREILSSRSVIRMKTDSQPLFDYSLTQIKPAGYRLNWRANEVSRMLPMDPVSEYEAKTKAEGACAYGFEIAPLFDPDPDAVKIYEARSEASPAVEPSPGQSLYDFLPGDLKAMPYIPSDMRKSVENMIEAQERIARNRGGE